MDLDDDDPQLVAPGPNGPRGIGKYLKRLRRVFTTRPQKAVKISVQGTPGLSLANAEAQVVETPLVEKVDASAHLTKISSVHSLHSEPTPAHLSFKPPLIQAPDISKTEFQDRPRFLVPAASEGNIITCPTDIFQHRPLSHNLTQRPNSSPEPELIRHTQRAEELFGKYGVPLERDGFFYCGRPVTTQQVGERVTKQVRVRIHYHCHRCNLGIGPNGICIICGHKKCRKCIQWPEKRQSTGADEPSIRRDAASIIPTTKTESLDNWLTKAPPAIDAQSRNTLTSSFLAGPRTLWSTRVIRRLCHVCHSPFVWTETICQDCDHILCSDCPRDPPIKLPDLGEHGSRPPTQQRPFESPPHQRRDRILKKPRIRVRYTCEGCGSLYREHMMQCDSCGHERCNNCPRFPPRLNPHPLPSPEILASLQQRLDAFS